MSFDLLNTVEYGGCSAKLGPEELAEILQKLPRPSHPNIMVDIDTHDDAGVYKLDENTALIYTTDFFPPVCSDPYEFGQIAAANALSDVYAMGGKPIMALNLMMFSINKIPKEAFGEILKGGYDKAAEANCLILGGHTIDDHPPKYGLAVLGSVHPDKLITNAGAKPGDKLILTKKIGTGTLIAGHKLEMAEESAYHEALESMKELNKNAAEILSEFRVNAVTDITGFGFAGHALKMAQASNVSLSIDTSTIPLFPQVCELTDDGCIPGACFRNYEYCRPHSEYSDKLDHNLKMICHDAQTSGGLLISVHPEDADKLLSKLNDSGFGTMIGDVCNLKKHHLKLK